jgi:TonB family protein
VLGLVFFVSRFFIQMLHLVKVIKKAKTVHIGGFNVVELEDTIATFSFWNHIFIGNANPLSTEEKEKVLRHEAVHVKRFHSVDILLINVIGIIFWFNPFIRKYKKIFVQLHEFEADARAVENRDVNEYCTLLAKVALQSADFKLANHFNNSLTIKRIEMMRTIKHKIKPWKMLVLAGIIPMTFFIISCQDQVMDDVAAIAKSSTMALDIPREVQEKYDALTKANPDKKYLLMETDESMRPKLDVMKAKMEKLNQSQISHISLITPTTTSNETARTFAIVEYNDHVDDIQARSKLDGDIFTMVDETATPVGGMPKFYEYIATNLTYPASAREKGIEGKVFIEFVVNTDGSVDAVGLHRGIDTACDAQALLVVQSSPKWIPGKNKGVAVRQKMILPITFSLNGGKRRDQSNVPAEGTVDEVVVVGAH